MNNLRQWFETLEGDISELPPGYQTVIHHMIFCLNMREIFSRDIDFIVWKKYSYSGGNNLIVCSVTRLSTSCAGYCSTKWPRNIDMRHSERLFQSILQQTSVDFSWSWVWVVIWEVCAHQRVVVCILKFWHRLHIIPIKNSTWNGYLHRYRCMYISRSEYWQIWVLLIHIVLCWKCTNHISWSR